MPSDKIWNKFLKAESFKAGWHLARLETKIDHQLLPYFTQSFAGNFERIIESVRGEVTTGHFVPRDVYRVELPKSKISIRPGSVIPLKERTVLLAAIRLIAEELDSAFPAGVYSYRLKTNPNPKKGIFKESNLYAVPFLKAKTISYYFDPWIPWYGNWPEFDRRSVEVLRGNGPHFLVVSDISAYFENIHLQVLRDVLSLYLPNEVQLVDFLNHCLEIWASHSSNFRRHGRGLPQGSNLFSYLGNVFLLPIDKRFESFCDKKNAKYYRYMDDIRIFTKSELDAVEAVRLLESEARKLHLNLQTAKTKILRETRNRSEIRRELVDDRQDMIDPIIVEAKKKDLTEKQKKSLLRKLNQIARSKPRFSNQKKIFGSTGSLPKLSLRTFKRLITAYDLLGSHCYLPRLLSEVHYSTDYQLMRKLSGILRKNPKLSSIRASLWKLVQEDLNLYSHTLAEIYWVVSSSSAVEKHWINHAKKSLFDLRQDPYVRAMASVLLSRESLRKSDKIKLMLLMKEGFNPRVKLSCATLLMVQDTVSYLAAMKYMRAAPEPELREFFQFIELCCREAKTANSQINYYLKPKADGQQYLQDNLAVIAGLTQSRKIQTLEKVHSNLKALSKNYPIVGLRKKLEELAFRTETTLKRITTN